MAGWWWNGALVLAGLGAWFCWGAKALGLESLYKDAIPFLVLALICAALAGAG